MSVSLQGGSFIIESPDPETAFRRALADAADILGVRSPLSCPDIKVLSKSKDKASIGISEIRAFFSDLFILPNSSDKKVYIINDARYLTPEAQNGMLKTLEEPPSFVTVFLVLQEGASLLPTVLSRCVSKYISTDFEGDDKDAELPFALLKSLTGSSYSDFLANIKKLSALKRDKAINFSESLFMLLRDILAIKNGKDIYYKNTDSASLASKISEKQAVALCDITKAAKNDIEKSANINLVFINLLIKFREEVH